MAKNSKFVNPSQVAQAWGMSGSHDSIRKFLESRITSLAEVPFGRGVMRMYDREQALSLLGDYRRHVDQMKAEANKRASTLGVTYAATARNNAEMRITLDQLQARVATLESGLERLRHSLGDGE